MLPEKILKEAASLVAGKRAEQHGDYTTLHVRIAEVGGENPDDAVDAASYVALWGALKNREETHAEKPIQKLFKK